MEADTLVKHVLIQNVEMSTFSDLIVTANGFIPADLVPGASVDAAFRKNLMKVINIEFRDLLLANQSVVQAAPTLYEGNGYLDNIAKIYKKSISRLRCSETSGHDGCPPL